MWELRETIREEASVVGDSHGRIKEEKSDITKARPRRCGLARVNW